MSDTNDDSGYEKFLPAAQADLEGVRDKATADAYVRTMLKNPSSGSSI
jgi:hypothetical protein